MPFHHLHAQFDSAVVAEVWIVVQNIWCHAILDLLVGVCKEERYPPRIEVFFIHRGAFEIKQQSYAKKYSRQCQTPKGSIKEREKHCGGDARELFVSFAKHVSF